MSKVCFVWELGQGFGHLVRYIAMIRRLLDRGDEVYFLAKDADLARTVFATMDVHVQQIEPGNTPPDEALTTLNSYAEILHNFGFFAPDALEQQLQPWYEKLTKLQPDVLVVDHSPTALLVNRTCQIPMISSGSGFTVPPRYSPMRPLRYWAVCDRAELAVNEGRVLRAVNEVLGRAGIAPLSDLCDLLRADCEWLLTYAELDHYGVRDGARYLGSISAPDFGALLQWAMHDGAKIFAYLTGLTVSDAIVEAVQDLDINICLYAPNLKSVEIEKFPPDQVLRASAPVHLAQAAAQCSAAITNSSLNTVSFFLRHGIPQLALPSNVERFMVGRRLELVGGGLTVRTSDSASVVTAKLRAVLQQRSFTRVAEQFGQRHSNDELECQTDTMLSDIDALLVR